MSQHESRRSGVLLVLSVAAILLLLATLAERCDAQVNFSPSWGKRAPGGGVAGAGEGGSSPCRTSVEAVLYIYKLVQSEAQKLVSCSKFAASSTSD